MLRTRKKTEAPVILVRPDERRVRRQRRLQALRDVLQMLRPLAVPDQWWELAAPGGTVRRYVWMPSVGAQLAHFDARSTDMAAPTMPEVFTHIIDLVEQAMPGSDPCEPMEKKHAVIHYETEFQTRLPRIVNCNAETAPLRSHDVRQVTCLECLREAAR